MGPDAKADMTKAMSAIILNIHLAKITDADSEASVRNKTLAANILADLTAAQFEANFDINYALWRSYLTQR